MDLNARIYVNGKTDGRTDVLTYVYLLDTYIVNFRLNVPNNYHKYPTSLSNLLGIFSDTNGINGKYPTSVYPINARWFTRTD